MKIKNRHLRRFRYFAPVFCSIAVLSTQLQAGPTVQLNGDESRDGMADSGSLGYVGGNTRIGVSIDRNLQGQADINQIIHEDDSSATSAEAWFGYKLKEDDSATKGFQGGGAKLNHQWVNDEADTVHKVFGAYDRNSDDQAKATLGYGQETEDLFWSGHVSKGMGDATVNGDVTRRAYDYGVGGEVGTFIDSTLTRVRAGLDYEFGTEYANGEERPSKATLSAGVEQFFHDTPHSVSLDVSGHQRSGGNDAKDTDFNARLGYHYEFGGDGTYQSAQTTRRRRVEIPGTPARPGRAAVPAIPATPAIAAKPAVPGRAAIPPKYERRAVTTPGHEFVKTTMKLENETFFKINSAELTPSATRNLDKIVSQIRGHGYLGAIRITGNTCGMGDPVYDQRLSERRANAVRDYLLGQGFNPEHLIARGLGKGSPKYDRADNDFKNRRVDLEYVTERTIKKQTNGKVHYKNVLVQEGRPAVSAQPARPGRAGHPGRPAIPAVPATPATPSRFIWKTESVKSAPLWIKRAIRNTIRHNKTISTYTTRTAQVVKDDTFRMTNRDGTIDVLENDSPNMTLIRVTQPVNGTVTIVNNKVLYVPNPGFSGQDTFTYTVKTRDNEEITATVNVEVPEAVNNAPSATADTATTNENATVLIDVLFNDSDPDDDSLKITSTSTPTNGSVDIVNNKIEYTPNTDYYGTDTFTYTIDDGNGNTSTALVTVNITDINEAPKATDDSLTTPENTSVTINAVENDTDPDNDALIITSVSNPSNGTVSIMNNNIVYTPTTNFTGTDNFTYTIIDSQGQTATANISVMVTNVNQPPNAVADSRTTDENTAVTIAVLDNDSDPDNDTLSITHTTDPANGSVSISGTNIMYTPAGGFTGTDTFEYTISDGNGQTSTATVTIVVDKANQPPLAVDDTATTAYQTMVSIPVADNDTDPDGGTTCVTGIAVNPTNGYVIISSSGTDIEYTPFDSFSGTDTFVYTACDDEGATSTATVTVIVAANTNMPPVLSPNYAAILGYSEVPIRVLEDDSDPEGDTLSIVRTEDGPSNGSVRIAGNLIYYKATSGYVGADSFYYVVSDGNGNEGRARVDIDVKNDNSNPTVATIPAFDAATGSTTPLDISGYLSDVDGDTIYIAVADALGGSLTFSGTTLQYTPQEAAAGDTDTIYITVSDGNGGTADGVITVNVK